MIEPTPHSAGGPEPPPFLLPVFERGEHPGESAAQHAVVRVPVVRERDLCEAVIARLMQEKFDALEAVYVVDDERVFRGAVRLPDLLTARRDMEVGALADRLYPRVGTSYDQEEVAAEAIALRANSVAVVDARGKLVGVVPALSLLDILRNEHVEDLHRLAGIQREDDQTRSALESPPIRRARHRLPWLLVGLAGSLLAALVASRFERLLARNLAVSFFIPAIVYLADAIGTQTEAIVVRGLSLSRLPLRALLRNELHTGALIGAALAALTFPIVALVHGDVGLGAAVAATILVAGSLATTIGLFLPWLLQRFGADPAFGSGPVATILQDVLSIAVYFAIASWVL